jgi:hypothetical protein
MGDAHAEAVGGSREPNYPRPHSVLNEVVRPRCRRADVTDV